MKKETFGIIGMHCVSCALTIEMALKSVFGVKNALVNFTTKKALFDQKFMRSCSAFNLIN